MGTVFIVSSFASQFFGKGDAARAATPGTASSSRWPPQVLCLRRRARLGPVLALLPYAADVRALMTRVPGACG